MTIGLWLAFLLVVGTLAVIDLGLVTRRPRIVTPIEALASFSLWVMSAVGFSLLVWYVYEENWLDLERALADAMGPSPGDLTGESAWVQWITAYVLEIALSLDNIAIAALLVRYFKVPRPLIGRTLFWTMLISLVCRWLLILGGAYLLRTLDWMKWVFCGMLVLAMLRTLLGPDENTDFGSKWGVRMLRRILPLTDRYDGSRLFTRIDGHLKMTPVMLVVLAAAVADLSYAADSVPAMFSITREPFIAFSASAFALLGLRSLFFALAGVLGRFRYLRVSLVFVLLCVAGKMFLVSTQARYLENGPTLLTLSIISAIMAVGIGASALRGRRGLPAAPAAPAAPTVPSAEESRPTPLEDLSEAVEITRRNLRKVVILIVGSAIALGGMVLVGPLPGPGGIPVILLGLTILATEFIWARRLLTRLKTQTQAMAAKADRVAEKTSPWLVPPVVLGAIGGVAALAHLGPFKPLMVYLIGLGPLIAVGYWGWMTIRAWRRQRRAASMPRPLPGRGAERAGQA